MNRKPTNIFQKICHQLIEIRNENEARAITEEILNYAFSGAIPSFQPWRTFCCPSSLHIEVSETIRNCEKILKKSIYELIEDHGRGRSTQEWRNLAKSYLLLPIQSYKELDLSIESNIPQELTNEMIFLNEEWKSTLSKPIGIDLSLPLKQRFAAFVQKHTDKKAFKKYFGKNMDEEESKSFSVLFSQLDDDLKMKLIQNFKDSKHPFWKRMAKKL